MLLQPLFQHHQNPYHGSVVVRMALYMHGSELVYEIRADDVPALQLGNAIQRELPQRRMRFQPAPEWHAETML